MNLDQAEQWANTTGLTEAQIRLQTDINAAFARLERIDREMGFSLDRLAAALQQEPTQ